MTILARPSEWARTSNATASPAPIANGSHHYFAFLSYSHRDQAMAVPDGAFTEPRRLDYRWLFGPSAWRCLLLEPGGECDLDAPVAADPVVVVELCEPWVQVRKAIDANHENQCASTPTKAMNPSTRNTH